MVYQKQLTIPFRWLETNEGAKFCTSCQKAKAMSEFSNKSACCRKCSKIYYILNSKRASWKAYWKWLIEAGGLKECPICNNLLELSKFNGHGKRTRKALRSWCNNCIRSKQKQWYKEHSKRAWAYHCWKNHEYSGYVFSFTWQALWLLAEKVSSCQICGIQLKYMQDRKKAVNDSASLDRTENNKENYALEDVMIICKRCNFIKSNLSLEDLVKFCQGVLANSQLTSSLNSISL